MTPTRLLAATILSLLFVLLFAFPVQASDASPERRLHDANTPSAASAGQNQTLKATIADGELDVFALNSSKGATIDIRLSWANWLDQLDIFLIGPSGREVARSTLGGVNFQHVSINATADGRYLLIVFPSLLITGPRVGYSLQSNLSMNYFLTDMEVSVNIFGLSRLNPTNITFTLFGVSRTQSVFGSIQLYADNGTFVGLNPSVSVSSLERYHTADQSTRRITQPTEFDVSYVHQYLTHVALLGLGPSVAVDVVSVSDGKQRESTAASEWSGWVDVDSFIKFSSTIEITPVHRFQTADPTILRADKPVEARMNYLEQWKVNVSVAGLPDPAGVAITFLLNGQNLTRFLQSASWNDWVDSGSQIRLSKSVQGAAFERWEADGSTLVARGPTSLVVHYAHQFFVTVLLEGLESDVTALASITQLAVTHQVPMSSSWSGWVDAGTSLNLPSSIGGTAGARWVSSGGPRNVSSGGAVYTVSYAAEYRVALSFATADGYPLPSPAPDLVKLIDPEGKTVTLTNYTSVWLRSGSWSVHEVDWRGKNVASLLPQSFAPSPGSTLTIRTQLRDLILSVKDLAGLPVAGAEVSVTYPDGTAYKTRTDFAGNARVPSIYPGQTSIVVTHLLLSASLSIDSSAFRDASINLQLPFSDPLATLTGLVLVVMAVLLIARTRRSRW